MIISLTKKMRLFLRRKVDFMSLKRVLSVIFALIMVCIPLASCGEKKADPEAIREAGALIEKSYEVNEILFGKGIPIDEESKKEALESAEVGMDVKNAIYAKADYLSDYACVDDIKEAALSVYTEEYCEPIFDLVFNGRNNDIGSKVEYARYIDDEYGMLTVRVDIEDDALVLNRTYDLSSVKAVQVGSDYIVFTVDSLIDGVPSDNIRMKMVKGESGWRLDTPTY